MAEQREARKSLLGGWGQNFFSSSPYKSDAQEKYKGLEETAASLQQQHLEEFVAAFIEK